MNSFKRVSLLGAVIVSIPLLVIAGNAVAADTLVATGSVWKYLDNGSNQGTAWRASAFNDSSWASGPAQLGYGDGDEATLVSYGPSSSSKYITTYFRRSFNVTAPSSYASLTLSLLRDDGTVVYLNGKEVFRSNMPSGTISYTTLASVAIGGADESTFYQTSVAATNLVAGANVLAVEIHQANVTSTDISFDLQLTASTTPTVTRGPYLQMGTPTSAVVRWRTDISTDSRVRYGTNSANLDSTADDLSVTNEHILTVAGLTPDTKYYYSIGTTGGLSVSDTNFFFVTSPNPGTPKSTRVWILGDSGTADVNAANVRNGYYNFTGTRATDLLLMLGDNAYETGTDAEYQTAVFNMYPNTLENTFFWPTLGNHDTAQSTFFNDSYPYFSIFTLPKNGEAGGVASGTEHYYSFDYGNIHFICLDSMTADRATNGAMANWLRSDLAATAQEWLIAFWHHPPYTKGSHNSDTESQLIEMRVNFLPILEAGGVDAVLTGHSHSYERSYLLNGHYGLSSTLTQAMKVDGGDGREDGTGAYQKPEGLAANAGAVYAVAGSSGKISGGTLNHPAMYISLNVLGSMVLDINSNRLDGVLLNTNGIAQDHFTIIKATSTPTPPAAPSGLTATAVSTSEIDLAWTDNATNEDGFKVERSTNGVNFTQIASVGANVVNGADVGLSPSTTYYYRVRAFNAAGDSAYSNIASATTATPPPAAPANLTASAGDAQVVLTWDASAGATSYNIKGAAASGGPYTVVASGVTATTYTDNSVNNGTTYYYVVSAVGAGGESANSNEASATPTSAAPSSLTATAVSSSQIDLAWVDNSSNEDGFRIERSVDGTNFTAIATNAANATTYSDNALAPSTTYYYRVRAFNAVNETAFSNIASARTFDVPPAAPTGLTALAGNAQVSLTWNASAGATSYNVKRSNNTGGPYTVIATGVTGTSYIDTTAANGTTYYYVVSAANGAGESPNSNEQSATPQPPPPPAAPSGLTATAVSSSQINLAWADNSADESGFKIERSTDGTNFTQIAVTAPNATTFADSGRAAATTYYYRVRAFNGTGDSAYSNVASATTFGVPPAAPSGLTASAVSSSQINLAWTDNSNNEQGFRIERGDNGVNFSEIATVGANVTNYSNTGLQANRRYYYRVRAYNTAGNSAYSNTANAKTPKR